MRNAVFRALTHALTILCMCVVPLFASGTRRDKKRQKSAGKVAIVAIVAIVVLAVVAVLAVIVVVAELSAGGVASRPDLLPIKN